MHRRRGSTNTPRKPEVPAAVQLWTSCLADLQLLQDGLGADRPAAARPVVARVYDHLRKVDDFSAKLPATTWNDLILRQKVALRLGKACSQAIQQQHHLSVTTAALAALCLFMHKAILQTVSLAGPIGLNIRQQLQQSGLLQVLPEALAAAAAMLQASGCDTAAAAAATASSAEQDSSEILDVSHPRSSSHCSTAITDQSGTGSGTNSSSTNRAAPDQSGTGSGCGSSNGCESKNSSKTDGPADAASIQQHAELLLCLLAAIPRLWPRLTADHPETSTHLAHIAVAGVQLVQAVMQAVSRQVQQAERSGQSQWQDSSTVSEAVLMYQLLLQAHTAMRSLLDSMYAATTPGSNEQQGTAAAATAAAIGMPSCALLSAQPQLEQLLSSPHYIQCLSLMAAVLSYSMWPPFKDLRVQVSGQKGGSSVTSTAMTISWYAKPSCFAPGAAPWQTQPKDLQQQQEGYRRLLFSLQQTVAASTAWVRGGILKDTLTEHQLALSARLGTDDMTVCWAAASLHVPSTQHYCVGSQARCQLLQAVADVLTYWKAQAHQQHQSTASTDSAAPGVSQLWPELEVLTASSLLPPLLVLSADWEWRASNPSHSQLVADIGNILVTVTAAGSSHCCHQVGGSSDCPTGTALSAVPAQSTLQQLRLAAISDLESFLRMIARGCSGQQSTTESYHSHYDSDCGGQAEVAAGDIAILCNLNDFSADCQQHGLLLDWALAAGPGSPEQQQLCSLLATLLKIGCDAAQPTEASDEAETVLLSQSARVAEAAIELLSLSCCVPSGHGSSIGSESSSTSGTQLSSVERAAAASASSQAAAVPLASSAPVAASAGLPCLVLLGRCCTDWAAYIAADLQRDENLLARRAQMQANPGGVSWHYWMEAAQAVCLGEGDNMFGSSVRELPHYLQVMLDWLQSDGISSALSAAGYNPQAIIVQLNKVQAVTEAASSPTCLEAGPVYAAIHALREVGSLLCSFAVTAFCNNPSCSNVTGPTELSLVSGRSCMCGDCRIAHYCSRACQKQHWRVHKHVCRALKAAAACRAAEAACQAAEAARVAAGSAAITQHLPSAAELQQVVASQQQQLAELKGQLAAMRARDDAMALMSDPEAADLFSDLQVLQDFEEEIRRSL